MKKYLSGLFFIHAICCCLFIIYGQEIKIKDLSETDNTQVMPVEALRSGTSTKSHTLVLDPPDTTKMVSVSRIMQLNTTDSINSASLDTIRSSRIIYRRSVLK